MHLDTLLGLDLSAFQRAGEEWRAVSRALRQAAQDFTQYVFTPLRSGRHWEGEDATAALAACDDIRLDLLAVAKQADALGVYLAKMATGDGDGYGNGNLKQAQDRARALVREAENHGLRVDRDGTVRHATGGRPGPSPAEQQALCDRIGAELRKVLHTADALDTQLREALPVIFGTEDTFRTEARSRRDGTPDLGDWTTKAMLTGISWWMREISGWPDASALLNHFLDGSGRRYVLADGKVDQMLEDLPTFRKDVESTLARELRKPGGRIDSGWLQTSSGTTGDDKVMNWYYALHHFQYRVQGEKREDGSVRYQVHIRKKYDWGVPSEHRRNPSGHGVELEQSSIARLHHTRLARDFHVEGHSRTFTRKPGGDQAGSP